MIEEELYQWYETKKEEILKEYNESVIADKSKRDIAEKKFHESMKKLNDLLNKKYIGIEKSEKFTKYLDKVSEKISKIANMYREK